jgi:hypothetical protein
MSKREQARRQEWMAEFERIVIAAKPELAGRLDWNTAIFFFNSNLTAEDAATRMIQSSAQSKR